MRILIIFRLLVADLGDHADIFVFIVGNREYKEHGVMVVIFC